MKRLAFILWAATSTFLLSAQNTSDSKIELYGFVRNYIYSDTRETFRSLGDMYDMAPIDRNLNELGEDLNEDAHSRMLAITSRLGVNVKPMALGNTTLDGKIEADFAGFSSTNYVLRLRQAYARARFGRQSLLVGQTWHPMAASVQPDVLAFTLGVPFTCGSRQPQVQYNLALGKNKHWGVTATALWQMQYMSPGPEGNSVKYQQYGVLPELFIGLNYTRENIRFGAGLDFLYIEPRQKGEWTDELGNIITRKVDDNIKSFSPYAYFGYSRGKLSVKAKTILGENTGHLHMLGGYGVTDVKSNGTYKYKPQRSTTSYIDIAYGKKAKVNLFVGYHKNLGIDGKLYNFGGTTPYELYLRGPKNLDDLWRVAPNFSYNWNRFTLGVEYEFMLANYGTTKQDATVSNTHSVHNHHLCGMMKYNF